jgi:microcystin-dependent protein
MAAPEAPSPWIVPNNPSLTQQIRFAFTSLVAYLVRMVSYTTALFNFNTSYIDTTVCPAGTVRMSISFVIEDGWLEFAGQTIVGGQTLYPSLWDKIPSDWKSGADIIFPDFRNRFPISLAAGQIETDIGNLIGSHTSSLSVANLPSHTHGINFVSGVENQAHNHSPGSGANFLNFQAFAGGQNLGAGGNLFPTSTVTGAENQNHNHNINGTSNATGSGTAFNTYPASMYIRFIVRVF